MHATAGNMHACMPCNRSGLEQECNGRGRRATLEVGQVGMRNRCGRAGAGNNRLQGQVRATVGSASCKVTGAGRLQGAAYAGRCLKGGHGGSRATGAGGLGRPGNGRGQRATGNGGQVN